MSQLPEVITALMDPARYPDERLDEVNLIQTQMSFVLLTGNYAYKIRKPVNLGYVDYSTLEKRKYFSDKELILNRRLCPDTYIEVMPVVRRNSGIFLGGDGEIIDYAVRMKRLPSHGMMDRLLENGELTPEMVSAVAAKVADFHAAAETNADISRFGALATISGNIDENFDQSRPYIGRALSQRLFDNLRLYFDAFLKDHGAIFEHRVAEGHIRDCHGDLYSAHINFGAGDICIYDCIEFNDRFRYGDTASEAAFLAMDLDRYGRADLRQVFVSAYVRSSGDSDLGELLRFYQAYRAHVRAKVACFKLDDPFVPDYEKAVELQKARGYFDLALAYTRKGPRMIIMVGFTGYGKSSLAEGLARHQGMFYISSDITRKNLAGINPAERADEAIAAGLYSREMTEKTYSAMLAWAEPALQMRESVILDATFLKRSGRESALDLARRHNAEALIIECRLDEEELKTRLEKRLSEHTVSDGRWEVYLSQKPGFEPVTEVPIGPNHVIIDTLKPVDDNLREIIDRLQFGPN
ncbi:AAA family ATPase [Dehalogenimonas sp. THU2]|uniref:bifunctional aminoglycoside phosphotransferase/ATP-binding protein n=1 Tax=Dehalogenimonas sp. THU2 TaxID=3151121 RepID=UPI00321830C3